MRAQDRAILAGRRSYELAMERWDGSTESTAAPTRDVSSCSPFGGEGEPLVELEQIPLGEAKQLTDLRFRVVRLSD